MINNSSALIGNKRRRKISRIKLESLDQVQGRIDGARLFNSYCSVLADRIDGFSYKSTNRRIYICRIFATCSISVTLDMGFARS